MKYFIIYINCLNLVPGSTNQRKPQTFKYLHAPRVKLDDNVTARYMLWGFPCVFFTHTRCGQKVTGLFL